MHCQRVREASANMRGNETKPMGLPEGEAGEEMRQSRTGYQKVRSDETENVAVGEGSLAQVRMRRGGEGRWWCES